MKTKLLILLLTIFSITLFAGEEEPNDWSYSNGEYTVNVSFPFETAVLTGPDFREGTSILRAYTQGRLESDLSFQTRLIRIVDALSSTSISPQKKQRKPKHN